MTRLRTLLTMFTLLSAAVATSAPAAARGLHGLSHLSAPVATGQYHHHDEGGGVLEHQADLDSAPQPADSPVGKIGHSHMAGSAFDVVPQIGGDLPPSVIITAPPPAAANAPILRTLGWSPQKRPPRTA